MRVRALANRPIGVLGAGPPSTNQIRPSDPHYTSTRTNFGIRIVWTLGSFSFLFLFCFFSVLFFFVFVERL